MAKTTKIHGRQNAPARYEKALRDLQIELVKVQKHVIKHGHKVLVIFEGRDAAGKDGTIKRIVEHLSPRETRVVALGKPSDRDNTLWYKA
jgi:polyphosphate kinase 2 (PPK2 family)